MDEDQWRRHEGHLKQMELALGLLVVLAVAGCFLLWKILDAVS